MNSKSSPAQAPPGEDSQIEAHLRGFNSHLCFRTLVLREIKRFVSVSGQTLLAPLINASLYLLVFGVSLGSRISLYDGISYLQFVVPGLVLMAIVNNAFANTSSSLFISRYVGSIVDLLVTPITPLQFIMGYTLAAMIRALLIGALVLLVGVTFADFTWVHPGWMLTLAVLSAFLFAQFGLLAAILSKNFDTLSMYSNFLIVPLIYLGGLFYPIDQLPAPWDQVSMLNPLACLISSFRSSIIGVEGVGYGLSLGVTLFFCSAFFMANWFIVRSGYKLRP